MEQWLVNKEDLPEGIVEFSELLCGCGDPQICWTLLYLYLSLKTIKQYQDEQDAARLFFVYVINHLKLTEHGTSIYGAWLTEKGKGVLEWLTKNVNRAGDLVVCY